MQSISLFLSIGSSLLLATQPRAAFAHGASDGSTGEPRGSFLYENFVAAERILDSAVDAHGGQEWVRGGVDFRLEYEGRLENQGHYERPWARHDYALRGRLVYSARVEALKWEGTQDYAGSMGGFAVLDRQTGVYLPAGARDAQRLEGDALDERWHSELDFLPHEYLRQALDSGDGLRLLGTDDAHDVVQYRLDNGELRALFIDRDGHLLRRVERIGHWKTKGDRLEWTAFSDYEEHGGVQMARHVTAHSEGFSSQADVHLDLSVIEVGLPVSKGEFVLPHSQRAAFPDFEVAAPEVPGFAPLPSHDLGQGVYILDVEAIDARSMLVEFADFTVIIEGGDHSAASERILDTAEYLCGGKPVRYVAVSHHHPLYTGGIRSFVNRGVTILTTGGNLEYVRDLATRPYRIEPDDQELAPLEPIIEVIDGMRVIDDGEQRLELHEFDSSTHTDEYVLTYVPGLGLGFLGDLLYSGKSGGLSPAGPRVKAVHRLVQDLGLDIVQFSQTWFLEDGKMLFPFSDVEEQVRMAKEIEEAGP